MKHQYPLCDGWQLQGFAYAGFSPDSLPQDGWLDARVPSDVHTTLMAHGLIGDPAVGTGDVDTAWVERRVWVYRKTLCITPEMAQADMLHLRFEGLDTLCDVYVDGQKLAEYRNMFVEHVTDVSGLAAGEHELMLVFWPVCECSRKEELPEGFWINYSTERAFTRKAGYSFGWDWTPRIITCGIWRPAALECVYGAELGSLHARTLSIDGSSACVALSCPVIGQGEVYLSLWQDDRCLYRQKAEGEVQVRIDDVRLWWTHDQGEPYLYTVRAELLSADGSVQQEKRIRLGVRTVEMRTRLADGSPAYVTVLNGREVFLKGGNWVPMSNRPCVYTRDMYRYYVDMAVEAHMNTLNLWGGGVYETDDFYDLCDERGILCWQYFMFACGEYPDWDEGFVANVRDEVHKVVDRLRSHACVGLWLGNVEGEMLCHKIHLQRPMHGARLFEELMPAWLAQLDPDRPYVPSSPWGGDTPNSMDEGDRHNWDVWFTDLPYTAYRDDSTTFASEFGLHAAPAARTAHAFAGGPVQPDDFLFGYMNRDADLSRMAFYFGDVTGTPGDLQDYVQKSMLIQSDGLACGVEHFRRRFPACGGAVIWQLNDCCICHSWSMIDHLGVPKMSYYDAKRFFAPVLVSLLDRPADVTELWVTNSLPHAYCGTVRLEVGDFLGRRVEEREFAVEVQPGQSVMIHRFALGGRYAPNVIIHNRKRLFYAAAWANGQDRFTRRFYEPYKRLLLPDAHLQVQRDGDTLTVRSDVYACQVSIIGDTEGLVMSDNHFDLLPGQGRTVHMRHAWGEPAHARALQVTAMNAAQTVSL